MSNVDCERRSPAFGLLVSNAATLKEAFIDPITTIPLSLAMSNVELVRYITAI